MKSKSKNIKSEMKCRVFYFDLFGKREVKYEFLWNNSINTIDWTELNPEKENYFFSPKDFSFKEEYSEYYSISNIFSLKNIGIATGNDDEYVKFDESEFSNLNKELIRNYFYRPYDIRKIYYNIKQIQRARYNLMRHIKLDNLVLCLAKINRKQKVQAYISNNLICRDSITNMTYVTPLFTYNDNQKQDNFTSEFREFIASKYSKIYTPEQILAYIYSILHCKKYRDKYSEFLKIDFPKIKFIDDEKKFKKLSDIGSDLINHHLFKLEYDENICKLFGDSDNYKIEKVEYEKKEQKVWINKDRYFQPVPENIWNFYVGGYQVLDKWLKERKKHERVLSTDDILTFIKITNILDFTIKSIKKIDDILQDEI